VSTRPPKVPHRRPPKISPSHLNSNHVWNRWLHRPPACRPGHH
jgi:hypothetical protein